MIIRNLLGSQPFTEGGVNRILIVFFVYKHLLHAYLSVVRNVLLRGLEPDGRGLHSRSPRRGADVPRLVVVVPAGGGGGVGGGGASVLQVLE